MTQRPIAGVTYGGVCPPGRLTTNRHTSILDGEAELAVCMRFPSEVLALKGLTIQKINSETGVRYSYGHFNIPRYDHFKDVQIELLRMGETWKRQTNCLNQ